MYDVFPFHALTIIFLKRCRASSSCGKIHILSL